MAGITYTKRIEDTYTELTRDQAIDWHRHLLAVDGRRLTRKEVVYETEDLEESADWNGVVCVTGQGYDLIVKSGRS